MGDGVGLVFDDPLDGFALLKKEILLNVLPILLNPTFH